MIKLYIFESVDDLKSYEDPAALDENGEEEWVATSPEPEPEAPRRAYKKRGNTQKREKLAAKTGKRGKSDFQSVASPATMRRRAQRKKPWPQPIRRQR
jgi:hypothetical protein